MAEILEEITRAVQTRDASLQEWMDKAAADLKALKDGAQAQTVNTISLGQQLASTTEGRHGITSTGAGIGLGRDDRR
jgi:hypothetical protein